MTNEELKNYFNKDYFEGKVYSSYTDSILWQILSEFLEANFGHDIKVCDVGCAKGFLCKHLRTKGIEAFGIDISEYCVKEANVDYIKTLDITDSKIMFDNKYFNIVSAFELLEHIPEDKLSFVLKEIMRVGKKFLFSVHASNSLNDNDNDKSHVTIKPISWWKQILARNGFINICHQLIPSKYYPTLEATNYNLFLYESRDNNNYYDLYKEDDLNYVLDLVNKDIELNDLALKGMENILYKEATDILIKLIKKVKLYGILKIYYLDAEDLFNEYTKNKKQIGIVSESLTDGVKCFLDMVNLHDMIAGEGFKLIENFQYEKHRRELIYQKIV